MAFSHTLMPRLLGSDYWDMFSFPERIFGQDFGGMSDMRQPMLAFPMYRRPSVDMLSQAVQPLAQFISSGSSMVKNDKDKFEVNLDVKQFKPEEIEVKHSDDHFLTIHGKHEERSDEHGLVSREFTRRYKLPKDVEPERMSCMWNQDGTMTIDAPRKPQQPDIESHERKIPIKMADERQRIDQHEAKGEPTFVKSAEQHEEERKQSAEPKEEEMEPEIVDMIKDVEAENEKDKEDKRKFEKPEIEKSDFVKDPQESTAPEREQVTG